MAGRSPRVRRAGTRKKPWIAGNRKARGSTVSRALKARRRRYFGKG